MLLRTLMSQINYNVRPNENVAGKQFFLDYWCNMYKPGKILNNHDYAKQGCCCCSYDFICVLFERTNYLCNLCFQKYVSNCLRSLSLLTLAVFPIGIDNWISKVLCSLEVLRVMFNRILLHYYCGWYLPNTVYKGEKNSCRKLSRYVSWSLKPIKSNPSHIIQVKNATHFLSF